MPIITGKTNHKIEDDVKNRTWTWDFQNSSDSLVLFAGKYKKKDIHAGGIKLQFYYHPKQEEVIEKVNAAQEIKSAVDYFTAAYGTLNYTSEPLKIVVSSALIPGGLANGNISCMGETTFAPSRYITDQEGISNGVITLVHEICHQWWGIGVLFHSSSPWSEEGLTVFSTYKYLQYRYGDAYAERIGVQAWKNTIKVMKDDFYNRNPEYLQILPTRYLSKVLAANDGGIRYDEMPLKLYQAEQLTGVDKFQIILRKLFRRHKNGLSYENFLSECKLTEEDLALD
jgi:aminopeptidase N